MPRTPLGARPRVLVVDDQEDVRTLLVTALSFEGYETVAARDAPDALRCLEDAEFSLVITDYAMPGGTGIALLREAASRNLIDGTPSLVVTAHPDLREAGGFAIMRKPLDLDRFLRQVRELLRHGGRDHGADPDGIVELVLYVSSSSLASKQALRNLKRALKPVDPSKVRLVVRDLFHEPLAGEADGILMTPTLIKRRPSPRLWIVGSLRDRDVLVDLLEGAGLAPRE